MQNFITDAKHKAARWARLMLEENAVVMDLETTGMKRSRMVQVAIIDTNGEILLDTLVDPGVPIPREATAIHGITDAMVRGAPTFTSLHVQIRSLLAGRTAVAYNAAFEKSILAGECQRHNLPLIAPKTWDCAMQAYAAFHGDWNAKYRSFRWHKLTAACGHMGIRDDGAHTAAADCRMTLALIQRMAAAQ